MFRRFAKPYERKLCERAHAAGLPYLMHICGKTDRILDDFADLAFDAVELDYKTDIRQIHEKLSGKVTLFGTLDPSGVLTDGSPELVEAKAIELLELYSDSPRYVMAPGCAIPATAPAENIRRMIAVTQIYPIPVSA
jgi:uroporphyrinogen decarboxylase